MCAQAQGIIPCQTRPVARQKFSKPLSKSAWTPDEYARLLRLVHEHGENWSEISRYFSSKTPKQCLEMFKNSHRVVKKGKWAPQEDEILRQWVDAHGANKWTDCSKLLKGRCGKQCRERWVNILNPNVIKGNWSDKEQLIIYQQLSLKMQSWS